MLDRARVQAQRALQTALKRECSCACGQHVAAYGLIMGASLASGIPNVDNSPRRYCFVNCLEDCNYPESVFAICSWGNATLHAVNEVLHFECQRLLEIDPWGDDVTVATAQGSLKG